MIQYKGYYIYFSLYLTQLAWMGTWEQVMIVAKSVLTLKNSLSVSQFVCHTVVYYKESIIFGKGEVNILDDKG